MIKLEDLVERKEYLEKVIAYSKKNLKNAPKGVLRCARNGNVWHYFLRESGEKGNGKYLDKSQEKLIKKLAKKKYLLQVEEKAEKELLSVSKLIKQYESGKAEDVYSNFPEGIQNVVTPISLTDEQFVEKWLKTEYPKNDFYEDVKTFTTVSGEKMRSKSEAMIANMLVKNNIPYLYEKPLELQGLGTIYPDFTLLDLENRREIYWEHMGMMDDSNYSERATQKIDSYASNGIFPGERLILTFESKKNPINIDNVEKMILKRLNIH